MLVDIRAGDTFGEGRGVGELVQPAEVLCAERGDECGTKFHFDGAEEIPAGLVCDVLI